MDFSIQEVLPFLEVIFSLVLVEDKRLLIKDTVVLNAFTILHQLLVANFFLETILRVLSLLWFPYFLAMASHFWRRWMRAALTTESMKNISVEFKSGETFSQKSLDIYILQFGQIGQIYLSIRTNIVAISGKYIFQQGQIYSAIWKSIQTKGSRHNFFGETWDFVRTRGGSDPIPSCFLIKICQNTMCLLKCKSVK